MIKRVFSFLLPLILCTTLITSCGSKKKLIYFQGDVVPTEVSALKTHTPRLEIGDILSIEVTSADPKIAEPFNQTELVRQGNQIGSYQNGVPATYGYLVTSDSTVSLPIVGKVKVGGLNREEAIVALEAVLTNYLTDAKVSLRILNFKITVLGEVKDPGTFSIPNERITILEAIGIAKDLLITGERSNILVIRHEDGVKKEFIVDLTSKDLFLSPAYYLKQNDIVYVSPNKKSRFDSSIFKTTSGIIISGTSLVLSTLILIFR